MDVESRALYNSISALYLSSGSSYRRSLDRVIRNCHSRWNRFPDPVRSVGSVVEKIKNRQANLSANLALFVITSHNWANPSTGSACNDLFMKIFQFPTLCLILDFLMRTCLLWRRHTASDTKSSILGGIGLVKLAARRAVVLAHLSFSLSSGAGVGRGWFLSHWASLSGIGNSSP
jgi:hypothetical protein